MPPKAAPVQQALYSHEYNIQQFKENTNKFPIQFDKKVPKQFSELYNNALLTLNLAPVPCLANILKTNKPVQQLHLYSLIIDLPSCQVIAQAISESIDVQNILITDCQFTDECTLAFLSFLNNPNQIQTLTYVQVNQTSIEPILQAIAFGTTKINLKIFKSQLQKTDYLKIEQYLNSPFNTNFLGVSLPNTFDLGQLDYNYSLKCIEVNQQQLQSDDICQMVDQLCRQIEPNQNLNEFILKYVIYKIFNNQEIKLSDLTATQQLLQIKQVVQTYIQLIKQYSFKKFEVKQLDNIKQFLQTKIQIITDLFTDQVIIDYLTLQQHTDQVIINILSHNYPRKNSVEFLGIIDPGFDAQQEQYSINIQQLKCVSLGDRVFETPVVSGVQSAVPDKQ